jgi:hypothetical protein
MTEFFLDKDLRQLVSVSKFSQQKIIRKGSSPKEMRQSLLRH